MVNQPATQQMIKDILDGVTPAGKAASADKVENALTLNINGEQTEYDGSAAKSVTLTTTPLAYIGPSLSTTVTPSEGAYYANTIAISNFNREPSVGESFIATVTYTPNGNVYLCTIQVDTLNGPPATNVTQATYTSVQQVSGGIPIATTVTELGGVVNNVAPGLLFNVPVESFEGTINEGDKVIVPFNVTYNVATGYGPYTAYCEVTTIQSGLASVEILTLLSLPPLVITIQLSGTLAIGQGVSISDIALGNFSRVPIEGDTFILFYRNTTTNDISIAPCRVTSVESSLVTVEIIGGYGIIHAVKNKKSYNIVFNSLTSAGKIVATCQLNYSEDVTIQNAIELANVLEDLGFTANSDTDNDNMFPASGYFKPNSGDSVPVVGFVARSGNLYICTLDTSTLDIQQTEITQSAAINVTVV